MLQNKEVYNMEYRIADIDDMIYGEFDGLPSER